MHKPSLIHTYLKLARCTSRHWLTPSSQQPDAQAATDSHFRHIARCTSPNDSHLPHNSQMHKPPLDLSPGSTWNDSLASQTCWIIHRVTKRCVLVCSKNLIYVGKLQTGEWRGYLFLFPCRPSKTPDYCSPQDRAIDCSWSPWPPGTTSHAPTGFYRIHYTSSCLTHQMEGVKSASRSGRLTSGKESPVSINMKVGGPHRRAVRFGAGKNVLHLPRIEQRPSVVCLQLIKLYSDTQLSVY